MRVIAGTLKGRRLESPTWEGLRPTSDKLRETLFNVLAPRMAGARVLDGYAGTGAVGIEAISRGAAHVTFVERDRRAQHAHRGESRAVRDRRAAMLLSARLFCRRSTRSAVSRRSTSSCSTRRTTVHMMTPGTCSTQWARSSRQPASWSSNMRDRQQPPDAAGAPAAHARADVRRQRADLLHMSTLAVYPGSFDPLTNGHVDIIARGARLFDRIIVAILVNAEKSPLFTHGRARRDRAGGVQGPAERRGGHVRRPARRLRRAAAGAASSCAGLRAVSDFEYEFQMALMNRELASTIETVFMMPAEQYTVHQLAADQGSVRARRPGARAGAGHGGGAPAREAGGTRLSLRSVRLQPDGGVINGSAGGSDFADCQLGDDGGDGDGGPAAPRGRRSDRLRRGRARLRHARRHQGRRARGARRRVHEVHAGRPASPSCGARSAIATRPTTASSTRSRRSSSRAGGKQALYNTALTLFGPGDEVITHRRTGRRIVEQVKLADATPVAVETQPEDGFAIRADAILRADHAADARHHHQLAVQSDRRADLGGAISARSPRWRRSRTSGSSSISATRS